MIGIDLFPGVEDWIVRVRLILNIEKTNCIQFITNRSSLVAPESVCFRETTLILWKTQESALVLVIAH